jgi:hypothetical protein
MLIKPILPCRHEVSEEINHHFRKFVFRIAFFESRILCRAIKEVVIVFSMTSTLKEKEIGMTFSFRKTSFSR